MPSGHRSIRESYQRKLHRPPVLKEASTMQQKKRRECVQVFSCVGLSYHLMLEEVKYLNCGVNAGLASCQRHSLDSMTSWTENRVLPEL